MLWSIKNKAQLHYYLLLFIHLVFTLWQPADSNVCRFGYHCRRRASDCFIDREVEVINYFLF